MVVQVGIAPRRIDILTAIDGVNFDSAIKERELAEIDGLTISILSKRYLVQNKRAAGRPKDLADLVYLDQIEN